MELNRSKYSHFFVSPIYFITATLKMYQKNQKNRPSIEDRFSCFLISVPVAEAAEAAVTAVTGASNNNQQDE